MTEQEIKEMQADNALLKSRNEQYCKEIDTHNDVVNQLKLKNKANKVWNRLIRKSKVKEDDKVADVYFDAVTDDILKNATIEKDGTLKKKDGALYPAYNKHPVKTLEEAYNLAIIDLEKDVRDIDEKETQGGYGKKEETVTYDGRKLTGEVAAMYKRMKKQGRI